MKSEKGEEHGLMVYALCSERSLKVLKKVLYYNQGGSYLLAGAWATWICRGNETLVIQPHHSVGLVKEGFETLKIYATSLNTFCSLYYNAFQELTEDSESFKIIQRFVIIMYARLSEFFKVNEARMEMFFKKKT